MPRFNRIFSDFVPVASGLTLVAVLALLWLVFLDPVSPLVSQSLVGVKAQGFGDNSHLTITRDLCFTRPSEAYAVRSFRRNAEASEGSRDEVYENMPSLIHLDGGCYTRGRRVNLPEDLPAGSYTYTSGLRFCNDIGRCITTWLSPVDFVLIEDEKGRIGPAVKQSQD